MCAKAKRRRLKSDQFDSFSISLSRFAGDILSADVVVRGASGAAHRFSVNARLALPGHDIQGRAANANLYTAIKQLAAKLARLSRKRKTRIAKTTRLPRS
jgi:ribosomal subunit interface protein